MHNVKHPKIHFSNIVRAYFHENLPQKRYQIHAKIAHFGAQNQKTKRAKLIFDPHAIEESIFYTFISVLGNIIV